MKKFIRILLGKNYKAVNTLYWKIVAIIYPIFFSKKGTLLYAGINVGDSFQKVFFKYKKVIGFEPNTVNYDRVSHYNRLNGINIYNYALSDKKGKVQFYLPDNMNNDASASLSQFSINNRYQSRDIIEVNSINLCDFLIDESIHEIDFYISDIEGYDFKVLETIAEKFIYTKKIKKIQVEAVNNEAENPFIDSTNYERDFDDILLKHYKKIGRGSGFVEAGQNFSGKTLDVLYELI